jgi:uncharacterized protein YggE
VIALTRELKIDPKHVDSTGLAGPAEYRWNEKDSQRVLLGYVVSRQVEVELRDLEQLGALLERAVSAGANQGGRSATRFDPPQGLRARCARSRRGRCPAER